MFRFLVVPILHNFIFFKIHVRFQIVMFIYIYIYFFLFLIIFREVGL